jgi:cell wall-associated NlpC family hydrolase
METGDEGLKEISPSPRPMIDSSLWEQIAGRYLGVPYLWGGTGMAGIDCSGFVQAVYRQLGVVIPRDAHQQMLGGRLIATHDQRVPLEAGDLLFFTHEDGRVGHVGLSLGGWRMIHAEEPLVRICSLDPEQPDYDAYRSRHFVCAKRYLV